MRAKKAAQESPEESEEDSPGMFERMIDGVERKEGMDTYMEFINKLDKK